MVTLDTTANLISILGQGGVVALPTETVYGLAIKYDHPAALTKLLSIKGRSLEDTKVFTLIPTSVAQISTFATIPEQALPLVNQFPTPLTLLLRRNPTFRHPYYNHFPLIGIRLPDHPLFQSLPFPIMLTSANRRGADPLPTAQQIITSLPELDAIFPGTPGNQPPSTIISFADPTTPTTLRQGAFRLK